MAPFLIRLNFPEAQSAEDTEKLIDDCLEDFKQKQIAATNLIKELYEKVQQWFAQDVCHSLFLLQELQEP